MKNIIYIALLVSFSWAQSSYSGLDSYYNAFSIASAGTVGALPNSDSDNINPSGLAPLLPHVQFSLVRYPANIFAQSVQYINALQNGTYGISIRRINYGSFNKIDEFGDEDGTYSAGDTWINGTISKGGKLFNWGVSGGLFVSELESYRSSVFVISAGVLRGFQKADAQIGLSISNFGILLSKYTDHKEKLPQKLTISGLKGLRYLPLEINLDINYLLQSNEIFTRIGGIFQLPYNFQLIFGINSDNLVQSTEYRGLKSMLSSSGIGISCNYKQYTVEFSGYSYGSGGWIYGTSFNFKL